MQPRNFQHFQNRLLGKMLRNRCIDINFAIIAHFTSGKSMQKWPGYSLRKLESICSLGIFNIFETDFGRKCEELYIDINFAIPVRFLFRKFMQKWPRYGLRKLDSTGSPLTYSLSLVKFKNTFCIMVDAPDNVYNTQIVCCNGLQEVQTFWVLSYLM